MIEHRYFEDFEPGDEHEDHWTPTPEQIIGYLSAIMRPATMDGRFTSVEGAQKLGLPAPIVPGPCSLSVLTRIVNDIVGMEARIRSVDVNFRRPVFHNQELRAVALVTDTDEPASESSYGRVKMDVFLENERGERPVQGVAVVDLPHRP